MGLQGFEIEAVSSICWRGEQTERSSQGSPPASREVNGTQAVCVVPASVEADSCTSYELAGMRPNSGAEKSIPENTTDPGPVAPAARSRT